jgi:glycosyltransferase involved in cell wall biosynthesis
MGLMRILHVTPYAGDAWAYGGIPRLLQTITQGLARRGHQVTVCTTDACDGSTRLTRSASGTTGGPGNIDLQVFPNLSNALAYHLQFFIPLGFEAYLRRFARSFDVAHLHACRNLPGVIAAYHLRRAGVPYLMAPNGTAPRIERRQMAKRIFDAIEGGRTLRGATRVLAVSQAERAQLSACGVDGRAVRVIPNPIALDEFAVPIPNGRFRQRFALPAGPLVLFLGRLTPRKRLDVIAHAMARLRHTEASLVIAGNDMGAGAATQSLVRALGLEERAFFTGLLRGRERLEALVDADVMVYPSAHEIFGLAPLESLVAGTPVVVADDSGCGEIVGATGGGRVVPLGDAHALADAIDAVLDDPPYWRAAAADAAGRVRAAYGDDVVCAALEELYGEMIASA